LKTIWKSSLFANFDRQRHFNRGCDKQLAKDLGAESETHIERKISVIYANKECNGFQLQHPATTPATASCHSNYYSSMATATAKAPFHNC